MAWLLTWLQSARRDIHQVRIEEMSTFHLMTRLHKVVLTGICSNINIYLVLVLMNKWSADASIAGFQLETLFDQEDNETFSNIIC